MRSRAHSIYASIGVVWFTVASLTIAADVGKEYAAAPIKMIVPFQAGGPSDSTARVGAESLAKELKQNVIVLNKPGGGATVGLQMLANSKPDGYTIGLATS